MLADDALPARRLLRINGRAWRMFGLAVAGFVVCVAIVLALLVAGLQSGLLDHFIQADLTAKAGRRIAFRHLRWGLWASLPTVEVDGLVVGSPRTISPSPLVATPHAVIRLRLGALMKGDAHLLDVRLDDPVLHLVRLGHGRNNYTFGQGGASGGWGRLARLQIDDGVLVYEDPERHVILKGRISHGGRDSGNRTLHLYGGGDINGGAFTVDAWGGSLADRNSAAAYPFSAVLNDGGVRVTLTGASAKPFDFRKFDVRLDASGPNLADFTYLFEAPAPNTAPFTFTAHLVRDQPALRMTDIVGRVGDTELAGSLRTDHAPGRRRIIQASLHAQDLYMRDLRTALSPRLPHAQTRSVSGAPAASTKGGRLFSNTPFNVTAMKRDDLDLRLTADQAPDAVVRIRALTARLRLQGGRLTLDPLTFSAAPGLITARLLLDASQKTPQLAIQATVRGARLAALKPGLAALADADVEADVDLTGRGESIDAGARSVAGRLALRLRQGRLQTSKAAALGGDLIRAAALAIGDKTAQSPLTCAVSDFQAMAGRLEVRDLDVVTGAGATRGSGAIDLGSETVSLVLQGTPAHPRPFQVNAPVHIEGPLRHPAVKLDLVKGLGRAVAELGLTKSKPEADFDCDGLLARSAAFGMGRPD